MRTARRGACLHEVILLVLKIIIVVKDVLEKLRVIVHLLCRHVGCLHVYARAAHRVSGDVQRTAASTHDVQRPRQHGAGYAGQGRAEWARGAGSGP